MRYRNVYVSPSKPGGLNLNLAMNNHAKMSETAENNRITGFGPGMGAALIGNNNRLGGSKLIVPNGSHRIQLGTIGWGVTNPNLD